MIYNVLLEDWFLDVSANVSIEYNGDEFDYAVEEWFVGTQEMDMKELPRDLELILVDLAFDAHLEATA